MLTIIRTNSDNIDFQELVIELDKDLAIKNGDKNDFFVQFNKIDAIKHAIVAFDGGEPVGCGAIKKYDESTIEVKRMFVPAEKRGNGVATMVLKELENWAEQLGYKRIILETGLKMLDAVALYKKNDYKVIANYGQYENNSSSICFEKLIH